jgi:hypothetical protein
VLRRLDGFPTGPNDAAALVVYEESATAGVSRSFDETGLADGAFVYYTAYTTDGLGWSPPARTVGFPRTPLASLTAVPMNASVGLTWPSVPSTATSYAGVTIARRETTPPVGPADPAASIVVRDQRTATGATDTGLKPGTPVCYAAYIHDTVMAGGIYYDAYSMPATATAVPLWEAPLYFDAMGYNTAARITGRVPTTGNPTCTVVIVKSTRRVPRSPTDGTRVLNQVLAAGQEIDFKVSGLTNLRPVWFSAFVIARDSQGTVLTSLPAKAAALPRTKKLSGFKATPGNARVTLSWTRPSSFSSSTYGYTYSGVRLIRKAGGYPTGAMDPAAKVIVSGTKTLSSFVDTGLTNLTLYCYRGYVGVRITKGSFVDYDYGSPSSASATPNTTTHTMRLLSYNRYASPYYYYAYGKSIVMSGIVSPNHAVLSTGARGYVTVYVYRRRYSSTTGSYYYAVVKTADVYLVSAGSSSTWRYSYRGSRGTYMLKAYFPGDGNHLPAWSTTRRAKVY